MQVEVERHISDIYVDFAEIFDTIKLNDYSDKQKDEMLTLFEGQTMKKCLDFILSWKDFASISELVLPAVQKQKCGNFETKECFLRIFDKAVTIYEEEVGFVNMQCHEGVENLNDEIEELKKKNFDLRREVDVLHGEVEDKSRTMADLEMLYNTLSYDFHKLNDKWHVVVDECITLKNIVETMMSEKGVNDERNIVERLEFTETIRSLRECVEEKNAHISQLLEEQKLLFSSVEIFKAEIDIKNCLLEQLKEKFDPFAVTVQPIEVGREAEECEVCKSGEFPPPNILVLQNKDRRNTKGDLDSVKNTSLVVDIEMECNDEDIKFTSTRKCLSGEILQALTELSDDDLIEVDHEVFRGDGNLGYEINYLEDSGDSGFHQQKLSESFATQFYSINMTSSEPMDGLGEERSFDGGNTSKKQDSFARADLHNKLRDIREHLTELENNLKARKRKVNKMCCHLLRIFYYFFEMFL